MDFVVNCPFSVQERCDGFPEEFKLEQLGETMASEKCVAEVLLVLPQEKQALPPLEQSSSG